MSRSILFVRTVLEHREYLHRHERLIEMCSDDAFVADLGDHHSICTELRVDLGLSPLLYAAERVTASTYLCGSSPCGELLSSLVAYPLLLLVLAAACLLALPSILEPLDRARRGRGDGRRDWGKRLALRFRETEGATGEEEGRDELDRREGWQHGGEDCDRLETIALDQPDEGEGEGWEESSATRRRAPPTVAVPWLARLVAKPESAKHKRE